MDISGAVKSRKPSRLKLWGTLVGAAVAAAVAVMGALPNHPNRYEPDDEPDTGIALEHRVRVLEQNQSHTQADVQSIKEDTHYLRDRLDHFIDSQKERR